jgi:hypothetical protein
MLSEGLCVGGYPKNSDGFPKHEKERELLTRFNAATGRKETKNLPQVAQVPKIMNPFTRALAPPL